MTLNAVSAQGMTKKHRPRVQHRPFALSCPASHPAPDTGRRQGDSGVLFTVCNMRWWRKCEAGRLRYDKSSSNRLVELMTYRSVIFWHCYSTLCIPTYTVIRWMKTIVKDEDSVHWLTLLIVKTHNLWVPISILLLLHNWSAESENSWLHTKIRKKKFLFLNTAMSVHWQSL